MNKSPDFGYEKNCTAYKILQEHIKRAEEGDANEEWSVGRLFEKGVAGMEGNVKEALKWYCRAANNKHSQAQSDVIRLRGQYGLCECKNEEVV